MALAAIEQARPEKNGIDGVYRKYLSEYRKLYGAPRVTEAMENLGLPVRRSTVSRWMREAGLAAKTKRRFRVVTTDSKHKLPLAANVLDRQFSPAKPGKIRCHLQDFNSLHWNPHTFLLK